MEEYDGIRENDKCAFWFGLMCDAEPEIFMDLMHRAAERRWPTLQSTDEAGQ